MAWLGASKARIEARQGKSMAGERHGWRRAWNMEACIAGE